VRSNYTETVWNKVVLSICLKSLRVKSWFNIFLEYTHTVCLSRLQSDWHQLKAS